MEKDTMWKSRYQDDTIALEKFGSSSKAANNSTSRSQEKLKHVYIYKVV